MSESIFAQTVSRAIAEYRQMLRRYLSQADRIQKLAQLNLKDPTIYENDLRLYEVAHQIVQDIEANMAVPEQGYYSYSGIAMFCEYLKEYLENYEVEDGHVIHRAQKASRALVTAIQLATLPSSRLNDDVRRKLTNCNEVIAEYGSDEQRELYRSNLERQKLINRDFYSSVLQNFLQRLTLGEAEAA